MPRASPNRAKVGNYDWLLFFNWSLQDGCVSSIPVILHCQWWGLNVYHGIKSMKRMRVHVWIPYNGPGVIPSAVTMMTPKTNMWPWVLNNVCFLANSGDVSVFAAFCWVLSSLDCSSWYSHNAAYHPCSHFLGGVHYFHYTSRQNTSCMFLAYYFVNNTLRNCMYY